MSPDEIRAVLLGERDAVAAARPAFLRHFDALLEKQLVHAYRELAFWTVIDFSHGKRNEVWRRITNLVAARDRDFTGVQSVDQLLQELPKDLFD